MYSQEKINPYGKKGDKCELVEEMFNNIAPTYDTLNHRLSWDIDKRWRLKAINVLKPKSPRHVLDLATGTGDFAILAGRLLKPEHIIGADISEKMMLIGEEKSKAAGLEGMISFEKQDSSNLSFAYEMFDAVISAFGLRNFADLDKSLIESFRVLKKGGCLCALELSEPVHFPMKQLFRVYSHTVLPIYGKLISKDESAYKYLTQTIEAFPTAEEMMNILHRAGFSDASFRRLTFGICTLYVAIK